MVRFDNHWLALLRISTTRPNRYDRDDKWWNAVVGAWEGKYVGNAHEELLEAMCRIKKTKTPPIGHLESLTEEEKHAPYSAIMPIVQSSGSGKSRTVDELSKVS